MQTVHLRRKLEEFFLHSQNPIFGFLTLNRKQLSIGIHASFRSTCPLFNYVRQLHLRTS